MKVQSMSTVQNYFPQGPMLWCRKKLAIFTPIRANKAANKNHDIGFKRRICIATDFLLTLTPCLFFSLNFANATKNAKVNSLINFFNCASSKFTAESFAIGYVCTWNVTWSEMIQHMYRYKNKFNTKTLSTFEPSWTT
jgi:hypothetical protein